MDSAAAPPTSEQPRAVGDPPAHPRPFRLHRARHGVLGGVCAGLSVAAGVDVTLVRLAFIVSGLAGFGVLAYLVLLFVMPREGPARGAIAVLAPPDTARWLRAGLLIVPLLSITGWAGFQSAPFGWPWWHRGHRSGVGVGVVVLLVGVGIVWWRRRRDGSPRETGQIETSDTAADHSPWWAARPVEPTWTAPPADISSEPAAAPLPLSKAPSTGAALILARIAAWLTVLGGVVLAGVIITLERLGVLSMAAPVLLAVVATAALAGLVLITIRTHRPWTLIAASTILFVPVLLGLGLGRWVGGVGDRIEAPTAIARLEPAYRLGIGHLRLDLHRLALGGETVNVTADTRIGLLDVIVPSDARVTLDAHVGVGKMEVFGYSHSGTSLDQHLEDAPSSPSGTVRLHVTTAVGQLRVCRAAASSRATTCADVVTGA